jgi:hypothetical protein
MNAPQYGYRPYQAAREGVAITSRFSPLAFMFATVKPKVFLNGYEMPVPGWGRTAFPLAPGRDCGAGVRGGVSRRGGRQINPRSCHFKLPPRRRPRHAGRPACIDT